MKQWAKIISYLLAFALGAVLFHQKQRTPGGCIQQLPPKAISYPVITYAPIVESVTHYSHSTDTVHIPANIDSLAIVRDFFAKRHYLDTIANDTNAFIVISDTLFKNRLLSRSVQKRFFTHSYKVYPPIKAHFYAGIAIGGNGSRFGFAPSLIYQDKHARLWGVNYDIFQKQIFVSAYFRIK